MGAMISLPYKGRNARICLTISTPIIFLYVVFPRRPSNLRGRAKGRKGKREHLQPPPHTQFPTQNHDPKPQSGTSIILQSPKSRLKGHGCSLHLQNHNKEPKCGSWMYQGSVTRSRCRTPVRNLHHPPKPQIRT